MNSCRQKSYLCSSAARIQGPSIRLSRAHNFSTVRSAQLEWCLADERLARQVPGVRFIGLVVVFRGWELVFCDAVQR